MADVERGKITVHGKRSYSPEDDIDSRLSKRYKMGTSTAEEGKQNKGLEVKIENVKDILEAAKREESFILGELVLENPKNPIKKVNVNLESYIDDFEISAIIETSSYVSIGRMRKLTELEVNNKIYSGIIKQYLQYADDIEESRLRKISSLERINGTIPLTGSRGTEFLIITDEKYKDVKIETQDIPIEEPGEEPLNPDGMNNILEDLRDLVKVTTGVICNIAGENPPDGELILSPLALWLNEIKRKPETSFKDIGGQAAAMENIDGFLAGLGNSDYYKRYGTEPPKAMLLYGPPGTGKTSLAESIAYGTDYFFHVRSAHIFDPSYGKKPAENLRNIFDAAARQDKEERRKESYKETVIFLHDVHRMVTSWGGANEFTPGIFSVLSREMNRIISNENINNIIFVASTTIKLDCLELLQPDLLKLFDRHIEVPLENDVKIVRKIFDIHMVKAQNKANKHSREEGGGDAQQLFAELDENSFEFVVADKNMSGAHISRIIDQGLKKRGEKECLGIKTEPVDIVKEIKGYEPIQKPKENLRPDIQNIYN